MHIINAMPSYIMLGNQRDFGHAIQFDLTAWADLNADDWKITYMRPDESATYPVPDGDVSVADNVLTWTISEAVTAINGTGSVVIGAYRGGEMLKHSARIATIIGAGHEPAGEAPEPVADWIEEATSKLAAVDPALGLAADATLAANTAAGRADTIADTLEGIAPKWAAVDISASGLAAGAAPTASIAQDETGTSIALGIPKGDTGDTGPQGPKGDTGPSAYDAAVAGGYTGTEADFNAVNAGIEAAESGRVDAENIRSEFYDGFATQLAEKAKINDLTSSIKMPHTHRILLAETNPAYIEPQLPFALEAFKGGYLIESCNFDSMVANASRWKYEFDILVIAAHQLEPYCAVTAQNVKDSVAEYMAAGVRILIFAQDGGRLQKYNASGTGETKVSLLTLFNMSFAARSMSAGTGTLAEASPYPLTASILADAAMRPQGASVPNFSSTDPGVLFPIIATQDAITANPMAIKPGAFAVVGYCGAINGDIPHSAYYQYVKSDALVQLLLEKPLAARVSMDMAYGKKIAACGVDADVTEEPAAMQTIVDAFGADRRLEIGLVANKVTADLADWYRNLAGVYLCSHTYYHSSGTQRITVTDELVTIDPATNMGRVQHPCKAIFTSIKNAADDAAFTVTGVVTTVHRLMPAQGTVNFFRDPQTSTSYDGYIRVNTADAALTFKVSYTYFDEYKEHLGSIEKLRSMGALTDDVLYLTAGNGAMMPNTYKYALDHNIAICEYQNFPNNNRLRVACDPIHDKVPIPMGYMFHLALGTKVNDAYWINGYTKADAKATLIPAAIAYCNAQEFPYVLYIHDFPLSTTHLSRVHDNPSTLANADWVKPTIEEVRAYQKEFLVWLIAQFEAQGCVWMTRGQYTRRYYDMQRYLAYSVEQADGVITLRGQNRGTRPLNGLTFRVPLASAPSAVMDSNGANVPHQYADGMLLLWYDAQPASAAVIRIS